jgi:hypothetical protein
MEASLAGQSSLIAPEAAAESGVEKGRRGRKPRPAASSAKAEALVAVDTERVSLEEAREAGAVQVGHQMWQQLRGRKLADRLTPESSEPRRMIENHGLKSEVLCVSKPDCVKIIPTAGKILSDHELL